ncbi:nuclear transport factor 2 family protein [Flavobacterium agrisoli]|uniref:Nuclear transport factor 2 family protein n=1 Tax=Flavobacterium agrisoli TaxID=2793066 RepID=A0A934UIH1_9FLAO|nr:nuclear transport factor 2 family protein [Flavobacterium agrisoli]MBK0368433.1 nuclear transport factor 2 family protein [Flavobacterium agrisoli]
MNQNEKTIQEFYTAFANSDVSKMQSCYHPKIQFRDPIFGMLEGNDVILMWEMLLSKANGNLKIDYNAIQADEFSGTAKWSASYPFGPSKKTIKNHVSAEFIFQDSLIIKHTDSFDVWKWSIQAFGSKGYLFGWTGFFQKKINQTALVSLSKYKLTKSL